MFLSEVYLTNSYFSFFLFFLGRITNSQFKQKEPPLRTKAQKNVYTYQ